MKQLVFADTQGAGVRYRLEVPDSMNMWRLDAFLDYMQCSHREIAARDYLPRPVDPLRHQSFRHLVCTPSAALSPPVRFWQNGREIRADGRIELPDARNLVQLRRDPAAGGADCRSLDLAARHRQELGDCRDELIELWDTLFDFDTHRIVTKRGVRVTGFGQLLNGFGDGLNEANRIRVVYRLAHLVYQAPFENVSKIIGSHELRSGLEMWRNIALGCGGMCAEKAWALKFACDALGVPNRPVFGAGCELPSDLDVRLPRLVENGDPDALGVWLQHHLLELDLAGRKVLVDVANGNMPFLFLAGEDAEARIRYGVRARMVYRTEKLTLTRASNLAGDTMLVYSKYRVPGLTYQFVFEQGLGLQITDRLFLGVVLDWHEERSRGIQSYYSTCAQRLALPYPRFVHEGNVASVPDSDFEGLLRRVLEALKDGFPRREYTGSFTFVLQPLTPHRWSRPQVSPEIRAMLTAGKDSSADETP